VWVHARTSAGTKRKYRADIILSTRRRGGVIVCGTPYRIDGSRRGWDGQTGEPARGIEENGSFPPHECVSLSPPTTSYYIRFPLWYLHVGTTYIYCGAYTRYGGGGFPRVFPRIPYTNYIYIDMNTRYPDRYFTPTIPSLYSFTAHVPALTRQ